MELFINGKKIDFKLEKEQNIEQFISSLSTELDKNDMYIISMVIDGKEYYLTQLKDIGSLSLNDIKKFEIKTLFKQELVSETSENIVKYLTSVVEFIQSKEEFTDQDILKIQEGLNWCFEALSKIMSLYNAEPDFFIIKGEKQLSVVIANLKDMVNNLYALQIDENFKKDFLNELLYFTEGIVKIITYVFISLNSINKDDKLKHFVVILEDNNILLEKVIDSFPQVAEKLQIGDEKVALNSFATFVNFIVYYINIIAQIINLYNNKENDFNFDEINNTIEVFSKNFEKIKEALDDKDYVALSDVLEYEISEPLKELIKNTQKLKIFLQEKLKHLDKNEK